MKIVGTEGDQLSFALVEPISSVISSLTILMTCWLGVREDSTSVPTQRSVTLRMKSFATA